MATGTRFTNKQDLLDALERVKFNQNYETSSEKIQNNDKDIVETLWPLLKFEVQEITGKVFYMTCVAGSVDIVMAADPADIAEIDINSFIAHSGSGFSAFPAGTIVLSKDTSNPNPYLHCITVSNPATLSYTGNFVIGEIAGYLEQISLSHNRILTVPSSVEGIFINLEEFSGVSMPIIDNITCIRLDNPNEEYDGKRYTIFTANALNLWGDQQASYIGRLAPNWYALVNGGSPDMSPGHAGGMMWYKDRWWLNTN